MKFDSSALEKTPCACQAPFDTDNSVVHHGMVRNICHYIQAGFQIEKLRQFGYQSMASNPAFFHFSLHLHHFYYRVRLKVAPRNIFFESNSCASISILIKTVKLGEFHHIFLEPTVAELHMVMNAICRSTAI
jgi:hypothetical protein